MGKFFNLYFSVLTVLSNQLNLEREKKERREREEREKKERRKREEREKNERRKREEREKEKSKYETKWKERTG